MKISRLTVGAFQENCYLLADPASGTGVLVDPGAEGDRVLRMVEAAGVHLAAIWVTHAHLDHVGAIAAVKRVHDVPIFLHPDDMPLYLAVDRQAAAYGLPFEPPRRPSRSSPTATCSKSERCDSPCFTRRVMRRATS